MIGYIAVEQIYGWVDENRWRNKWMGGWMGANEKTNGWVDETAWKLVDR